MIPNGKQIIIDGHKVVFESEPSDCSGCFFENMDSCPDCDEGIWVEEKPSPWHTGTPTEDGWYVCFTKDKDIPYQSMKFKEGWWWDFLNMVETKVSLDYVVAWQKIEPFEEASE